MWLYFSHLFRSMIPSSSYILFFLQALSSLSGVLTHFSIPKSPHVNLNSMSPLMLLSFLALTSPLFHFHCLSNSFTAFSCIMSMSCTLLISLVQLLTVYKCQPFLITSILDWKGFLKRILAGYLQRTKTGVRVLLELAENWSTLIGNIQSQWDPLLRILGGEKVRELLRAAIYVQTHALIKMRLLEYILL